MERSRGARRKHAKQRSIGLDAYEVFVAGLLVAKFELQAWPFDFSFSRFTVIHGQRVYRMFTALLE